MKVRCVPFLPPMNALMIAMLPNFPTESYTEN
jgi:hypothetical protein